MTEEAALFDSERWAEAARLILKRVVDGETGDDEGNKQVAQYHLRDRALPAPVLPGQLRDLQRDRRQAEPPQVQRDAALAGEARDAAARAGGHHRARGQVQRRTQIARFNNPQQRDLYWQLNYLLGRYKYRNRSTKRRSPLREGRREERSTTCRPVLHGHLERAAPQVGARGPVVPAHREGDRRGRRGRRGRGPHARPRVPLDGAHLLLGVGPPRRAERRRPSTRRSSTRPSSTGTASTSAASTGSTRSSSSRGPTSWPATTRTRSATSTRSSRPTSRTAFYPEASILQAVIYFAICQYEDATSVVAKMKKKYEPIKKELEAISTASRARAPSSSLLQVPQGGARRQGQPVADHQADRRERALRPSAAPQPRVRPHPRRREARFKKAPGSFRDSPLGGDVEDALSLARDMAVRNAGTLARERYQRNLDELNEHLRDAQKILIDITAAERNKLDQQIAGPGHQGRRQTCTASSSRTRSTCSGRSTASIGATSSASTVRWSEREPGPPSRRSARGASGQERPEPARVRAPHGLVGPRSSR
jgi:hypothetical protein